ncbi:HU family DNA-binding protein [Mycoplasma struthionis]|uniref:HU family DNA-binding protein n=1 Tax=Mycoplasma struthionis TaxID=538220 RepID=A0A3G8LGH6_9MOLU|nr:HU family DNA-binding protein [Mycoplasma struthionis]AZG68793.1 HU family DNA-binding protein [Mycoplasma struthionis]TPI01567.1 HU family DNA-binding protein [Mycoplasma struthionis]
MNKKELIIKTSQISGYQQTTVEAVLDEVITIITDEIKSGNTVSISGWGLFSSKQVEGRTRTHNITKKTIQTDPRIEPRFKFSKAYKTKVNN